MRFLLAWVFVLLSWPSYAASEEFPAPLRGLWGETKETCDYWKVHTAADVRGDHRWLRISAKGVFGSTEGRFLREVAGQAPAGATAEIAAEMQTLDAKGAIVLLTLSADGHLRETLLGEGRREIGTYQRC
ncbi:hypothetical protein ACVINW_004881 [Bradyrhizobium sp. USDA 4461]